MQKNLNLSNSLRVVGAAALVAGLYTAALLYASFGAEFHEKLGYSLVGVIFAAAGGLLLPAALELWRRSAAVPAGAVFVFWFLAILPLGLAGHGGYFSLAQANLAASGLGAQAARAKLEAVETQAAQLAGAANFDVSGANARLAQAQAELQALRAVIADCERRNMKSKCVTPKTLEAGKIEAEILGLEAQLSGASRLAELSEKRAMAAAQLADVGSGAAASAGSVHPLFQTLGDLFGTSPIRARAVFLAWSAVALECIAAIFFVIAGAVSNGYSSNGYPFRAAGVELPETVPALDTGGKITSDGIASLHSGEIVLNAAAVEALERLYPGLLSAANNGYSLNGYASNGYPLGSGANRAGAGICNHCGGNFDLTRTDKEYCCESCRVAAWENRTGAKLRKGNKGKKAA